MQKELEVWKAENERHTEAIRKEERYMHVYAALEKLLLLWKKCFVM